ncbi:MAG: hypothetical protein IMZ55_01480, partial [Acidobacteria bacterium]|nr:hypothetical protein [Acidobacteriota bacterium]
TTQSGGTAPAASRHVLPLFQDKVPEAYREHVPLPFGVSFTYFRMDERLTLSDPSLVFNGQPIPKQLLQADSVATLTDSYSARFDAWVFPFLNVYGTATRISGDATDVRAQIIGFPPVIPERVGYSGTGYGVGFTAAFGYRAFFASYDCNWNWQTAGVLSITTVANVQGPRVGVQLTPWGYQGNVYVGAMRQTLRGRQSGALDLPGVGSLAFDLKATPEHTWNPAVGAEVGVTRHIRANLEAGFGGRKYLLLGGGYRF